MEFKNKHHSSLHQFFAIMGLVVSAFFLTIGLVLALLFLSAGSAKGMHLLVALLISSIVGIAQAVFALKLPRRVQFYDHGLRAVSFAGKKDIAWGTIGAIEFRRIKTVIGTRHPDAGAIVLKNSRGTPILLIGKGFSDARSMARLIHEQAPDATFTER